MLWIQLKLMSFVQQHIAALVGKSEREWERDENVIANQLRASRASHTEIYPNHDIIKFRVRHSALVFQHTHTHIHIHSVRGKFICWFMLILFIHTRFVFSLSLPTETHICMACVYLSLLRIKFNKRETRKHTFIRFISRIFRLSFTYRALWIFENRNK